MTKEQRLPMTKEQMWKNHNEWIRKREFRKKLMKCYPDLGELCEMRFGIKTMINEARHKIDRLIGDDVAEDDAELLDLKWNKKYLEKVFAHLDKEAKELFERYGVEDKCQER